MYNDNMVLWVWLHKKEKCLTMVVITIIMIIIHVTKGFVKSHLHKYACGIHERTKLI